MSFIIALLTSYRMKPMLSKIDKVSNVAIIVISLFLITFWRYYVHNVDFILIKIKELFGYVM